MLCLLSTMKWCVDSQKLANLKSSSARNGKQKQMPLSLTLRIFEQRLICVVTALNASTRSAKKYENGSKGQGSPCPSPSVMMKELTMSKGYQHRNAIIFGSGTVVALYLHTRATTFDRQFDMRSHVKWPLEKSESISYSSW